jgi:2-polyprenyl-3-methyl-5-hydroxy-6-metoxy-1,4-benzoquinol methylase
VTKSPPSSKIVREEYNQISSRYAALYEGEGPLQHFYHTRLKLVSEFLAPVPRGLLLDVGSGPGIFGDRARELGFRYMAADLSFGMARECLDRAAGQVSAVNGSVEALPFVTGTFDVVTALGCIEYVGHPDTALAECRRVLRPGGSFVLSLLNSTSPYRAAQRVREHFAPSDRIPAIHFSRSHALRLVKQAGFHVKRVVHFDMEMIPSPFADEHPRIWKRFVRMFEPLSTTPLGRLSSAILILAVGC